MLNYKKSNSKYISPAIQPDSFPNIDKIRNPSFDKSNFSGENALREEITLLDNLWNDLGVTSIYKEKLIHISEIIT